MTSNGRLDEGLQLSAQSHTRDPRAVLEASGAYAVLGLRLGEALEHKLLNKATVREGRELQILRGRLRSLLIPIRVQGIYAVDRVRLGEALKLKLLNKATL